MTLYERNAQRPPLLRVIIAGSRHLVNYRVVVDAVHLSGFESVIGTVVSGACRGADRLGEKWAKNNGKLIQQFSADWVHLGPKAGPIRNQLMVDNADAVIGIKIAGVESRGTDDVIRRAEERKLPVFVYSVDKSFAFQGESVQR